MRFGTFTRAGALCLLLSGCASSDTEAASTDGGDGTTVATSNSTTDAELQSGSSDGAAPSGTTMIEESGSTDGGDTDGLDSTSDSGSSDGGEAVCGPSSGGGGASGLVSVASADFPATPGMVYVPSLYTDAQPLPVMVALHGSGGTAQNFIQVWDDIAESEGFIVIVPESVNGGASWNPGNDAPIIGALLDHVSAAYAVDECRLYMTGYSAGAHVTYILGLASADAFAGLGIQAGSLTVAEDFGVWPNQVARTIAVDIRHGTADPVVPFSHAEAARDALEAAGHVVHFGSHAGGHEIGPDDPMQMWLSLRDHRLDEG